MLKASAIISRDRIISGTVVTPFQTSRTTYRSPSFPNNVRSMYKVCAQDLEKLRRFQLPNRELVAHLSGRSFAAPSRIISRVVGNYKNIRTIDEADVALIDDATQLAAYHPFELITKLDNLPNYVPVGEVIVDSTIYGVYRYAPTVVRSRRARSCGVAERTYGLCQIALRDCSTPLSVAKSIHNVDIARAVIARYHVDEGGTEVDSEFIASGDMNFTRVEWSRLIRVCEEYVKRDGKVKIDLSQFSNINRL